MRSKLMIGISLIAAAVAVAGTLMFFNISKPEEEFKLVPGKRTTEKSHTKIPGTDVGTGWSIKEKAGEAVREALDMALGEKKSKTADFVVIFASSGSDMKTILSETRKRLGVKAKIYGGASDSRGVITDKGFIKAAMRGYGYEKTGEKTAIAIMTATSKDIVFGVGSADFTKYPSVQDAAKDALAKAIKNAGKTMDESPKIVMITPTIGGEEDVLDGIEQMVGNKVVILGGTTGGPSMAVFGDEGTYEKGLSLAVIYTDLPLGWTFEGGFDVAEPKTGIVTKVNGHTIVEIDNRPALDVYDEWLGGKIAKLFKELKGPDAVRDLLTLHPIYRKYKSVTGQDYYLFSHPWPEDEALKKHGVNTSTNIKLGERIYLSHGTWEILLNRIGNLPRNARRNGGVVIDKRVILGIGYLCGGVMGTIPEKDRGKMAFLINNTNYDSPFIANFTWGEQGHFPGVGNKHGNLTTSFIVIGEK